MKQKSAYNKQTKFTNQDLENIIKISQSSTNMSNLKQNEILKRSLELLYPGEDKNKLLEKLNISENVNLLTNHQKIDEYSTQPKSTKNREYDSINTLSKTSKLFDKSMPKKPMTATRSLTPKAKLTTTNSFSLNKTKAKTTNLNKSVSLRENSKLRDSLNKSSIFYQDNVRTLESLISEIKHHGFNRTKQEINDNIKIKQEIEANIEALQKKKTTLFMESKQLTSNNSKIVNETHVYHNKGERMKREVFFVNKDIPSIIQEIDYTKNEIIIRKNENTVINNEILEYEKDILLIKDEIRRMNKQITTEQKEKDNIRNSINLLSKHNVLLNEKIREEEKKSREFLNNISVFVEKSIKSSSIK